MNDQIIDELVREEKRKYNREWYAKNKDKAAIRNRRYWEKKAAARLAAQSNTDDVDKD